MSHFLTIPHQRERHHPGPAVQGGVAPCRFNLIGHSRNDGAPGNPVVPLEQRFDVTSAIPSFTAHPGVANMTPLHRSTAAAYGAAGNWSGQHFDINLPQVYDMLARFFGQ
jgi:hypothetical protein